VRNAPSAPPRVLRALAAAFVVVGAALFFLGAADAVRLGLGPRAPAPAADAATHPRAVLIGPDGIDHRWLVRYLDEDARRPPGERRLPNLAALRAEGALHPLRSETPPESPVAWASLLTGVNPGRHGILDFVRPGASYRPLNGMVDVRRMRLALGRVPIRPATARSRLAAPTFLERIHAAGYPVLGIRQPLLFPARPLPGARLLAGLGTPDIAGGAGFYAVWSSRVAFPSGDTVFGGVQIPLDPDAPDLWDTTLPGPIDPTRPPPRRGGLARATAPLRFEVRRLPEGPAVAITLAGRTEVVPVGARSPFMVVPFDLGTLPRIRVRGHVRFEVKKVDPLVVLADPVNIYAPDAPLPLTTPPEWGAELFARYGPFETVGWTEQTFALNDFYQDDAGFLRDLLEDMDRGAALLLGEIDRGARCVLQVFTATDRALHGFQRLYDPEHPLHEPGRLEALGDPMLQMFERLDRLVGEVQGRLGEDDLLIVCSDHGFLTWRHGVNLNQWLVEEGYMALRGGAVEQNLRNFFHDGDLGADAVDWSRTRAYAMGLGQIYLNRAGREEEGIVTDQEADGLVREIRERLLALRDPLRPAERPIRDVFLLRELYSGPEVAAAAEIQVGFAEGYRVSWQTALLGGMGRAVFEANDRPWSGDHCSTDPALVPGILLVNRPVPPAPADRPYHVRDVAATVLAFFGLDPSDLEGRPVPLGPPTTPSTPGAGARGTEPPVPASGGGGR